MHRELPRSRSCRPRRQRRIDQPSRKRCWQPARRRAASRGGCALGFERSSFIGSAAYPALAMLLSVCPSVARSEPGAPVEAGVGFRAPAPSFTASQQDPFAPWHSPTSAPVSGAGWPWGVVVLARSRRVARVTDVERTRRTEPDVANPVSAPAPAPGVRGRDAAARRDGRGGARRKLWGTGALRERSRHWSRAV
jgi:hypothetical protein